MFLWFMHCDHPLPPIYVFLISVCRLIPAHFVLHRQLSGILSSPFKPWTDSANIAKPVYFSLQLTTLAANPEPLIHLRLTDYGTDRLTVT